jgi:hypothetical protein
MSGGEGASDGGDGDGMTIFAAPAAQFSGILAAALSLAAACVPPLGANSRTLSDATEPVEVARAGAVALEAAGLVEADSIYGRGRPPGSTGAEPPHHDVVSARTEPGPLAASGYRGAVAGASLALALQCHGALSLAAHLRILRACCDACCAADAGARSLYAQPLASLCDYAARMWSVLPLDGLPVAGSAELRGALEAAARCLFAAGAETAGVRVAVAAVARASAALLRLGLPADETGIGGVVARVASELKSVLGVPAHLVAVVAAAAEVSELLGKVS